MATPFDPSSLFPPPFAIGPDLASLQYPWNTPPPDVPPDPNAGAPAQLQPGLGIPAAAVDAAVPPPPELGPQPEGAVPPPPPEAGAPVPPPVPYGAGPAIPPPPAPFGPAMPSVSQLPGLTVTTEPPAIPAAGQLAADPLAMRDNGPLAPSPAFSDEQANAALARMSVNDPAGYAAYKAKWQAAKDQDLAAKALEASTANKEAAARNADTYQRAMATAQQKANELEVESKALAQQHIDPSGGVHGVRLAAGVLGSIFGGLVQGRTGAARNAGADALADVINRGIETQKADIANQRGLLSQRQGAVAEMFARTGDMYRATETARAAAWESTIQQLQAEQLKYDPRGKTAFAIADTIQGARAQQQQAASAYGQQTFKNALDIEKANQEALKGNREDALAQSTIAKNAAETAKLLGGLGGAGVGSGTNPSYTVPTGMFDPFTQAPIMGKRQIGGHGEDAKERKEVAAQLGTYAHVQDYWHQLAALGDQIGYAKSLGESVWSAQKSTLGAKYDAAREALTVYLTKELGDKLTQGQLEAQAHRIPLRASLFEVRDPGQQIRSAQGDADRDFARDMNLVGIDASPIIKHAQQMRAPAPSPSGTDAVSAAQQALAGATSPVARRDAQAQLDAAKQQLAAENIGSVETKQAIDLAEHSGKRRQFATADLPPVFAAEVQAHNAAAEDFNLTLKKYHQVAASTPKVDPKLKGEAAQIRAEHDREVAMRARAVAQAHAAVTHASDDLWRAATSQLSSGNVPPDRLTRIGELLDVEPPKAAPNEINRQVEQGAFSARLTKRLATLDEYQRDKVLGVLLSKAGR